MTNNPYAEPKNVHEALFNIMAAVTAIGKEDKNGLRYTIASEEAFLSELRPLFIENQVMTIPIDYSIEKVSQYVTKKGAPQNLITVLGTFEFLHVPSGTSQTVTTVGTGADSGDKNGYKAMTGAFKYALRESLMLITTDDPDYYSSDDQEADASSVVLESGSAEALAAAYITVMTGKAITSFGEAGSEAIVKMGQELGIIALDGEDEIENDLLKLLPDPIPTKENGDTDKLATYSYCLTSLTRAHKAMSLEAIGSNGSAPADKVEPEPEKETVAKTPTTDEETEAEVDAIVAEMTA